MSKVLSNVQNIEILLSKDKAVLKSIHLFRPEVPWGILPVLCGHVILQVCCFYTVATGIFQVTHHHKSHPELPEIQSFVLSISNVLSLMSSSYLLTVIAESSFCTPCFHAKIFIGIVKMELTFFGISSLPPFTFSHKSNLEFWFFPFAWTSYYFQGNWHGSQCCLNSRIFIQSVKVEQVHWVRNYLVLL